MVRGLSLLCLACAFLGVCEVQAEQFKIVCYFTNWAFYRPGEGKYVPEDIDPSLCTHINYAFAVLDQATSSLKPHDSWADIDNKFYEKVVGLKSKNPNLKVVLAVGGWSDSAGPKYSQLVADASKRKAFIDSAIQFLKKYKFDGLDLDWEFPNCWQGACGSGPQDKANFAIFAKELREAFDKQSPKLELSAAVSAAINIIDNAYDVASLAKSLDHINVMAYDYHGAWEGVTGHHAPLYASSADKDPKANIDATLKHFVQLGSPKSKLVMGMPAYGKSFTLSGGSTAIGAPTSGYGKAGDFTREAGNLAYYEICKKLKSGWKKARDPKAGPYAYGDGQWVGFDDPEAIAKKAQYVKDNGYGGAMVWDMNQDDFKGTCCSVKNPIISTMNYVLNGKGKAPEQLGCP